MGTILGRGTLAFDTKLGPPLAPPRGPSAEALRKPRRAVFARQFRRSKVRQLRSFEATQPTGKTQGKGWFEIRAVLCGAHSALWWLVTVACTRSQPPPEYHLTKFCGPLTRVCRASSRRQRRPAQVGSVDQADCRLLIVLSLAVDGASVAPL